MVDERPTWTHNEVDRLELCKIVEGIVLFSLLFVFPTLVLLGSIFCVVFGLGALILRRMIQRHPTRSRRILYFVFIAMAFGGLVSASISYGLAEAYGREWQSLPERVGK